MSWINCKPSLHNRRLKCNIKCHTWYSSDNSDLKVYILKIYYEGENYYKVRYNLVNKKNGIVYELNKKATLYKSKIDHWEATL